MGTLTLKIVTPLGALEPLECDSVRLTVCDDENGSGGGSYGIRAGHARALFALDRGPLRAFLGGEQVFSARVSGGFALAEGGTVTALVEEVDVDEVGI